MLTDKQLDFFKLINDYYKKNNLYPNLKIIKKITNYKSYNTIYKYLNKLEYNNYLIFDNKSKQITYLKSSNNINNIYKIPFINKKEFINIENNNFNSKYEYIALEINNNSLKNMGIIKSDIVIIEKNKNYLNNKFVLITINDKCKILKYQKKDGFIHLINDKHIISIINNNDIIGKVVLLIRNSF